MSSIAQSIFAAQARDVAEAYASFADELETLLMPNDPEASLILREDIKRSREMVEAWRDYAEAMLGEERH
jgi:hypothetical protein